MTRRITGIGETVLDIIFRNDQPTAAIPGGSTFNAMISLGRTAARDFPGTPVRMVTETGSDHIGDIVTSFMEANGVSTEAVTRNPVTQSHLSLAFLDSDNNAQYEFYKDHASASLQRSDVEFTPGDIVLFGSYFAINPKIRSHTSSLLTSAREAGAIIYYDINFRRSHLKDLQETLPNIVKNCKLSDVVRGSSEDFGYLYGTEDPETIYNEHIKPLCPVFICTCGPDPIHVFIGERHLVFPVKPVETISTIGAGDNFNAGFIYALIRNGIIREDIKNLSDEIWSDMVSLAQSFSAAVCASIHNYVDPDFTAAL